MNGEIGSIEIDVYTRLAVQDMLLRQLYLFFATGKEDPHAVIDKLEAVLVQVIALQKPPAEGIEDKHIKLLQAQRELGPELIRDFFRVTRSNLPKT